MISRSFFQHYLRTIDIRYRLITSFLLVSLLPLFICGGIFYVESREAIQKKTGVFEAEVVKQVAQNIQLEMQKSAAATAAVAGGPARELTRAADLRSASVRFPNAFEGVHSGSDASDTFVLDVNSGNIMLRAPDEAQDGGGDTAAVAPAKVAEASLMSGIGRIVGSGGGSNFVSYVGRDGQDYLAAFTLIPDTTWAAVSSMPQQALIAEVHSLRNKIISIGVICSIFVLLLSYVICRSISVPLSRLVGIMKATESGNYRVRLRCDGNDEIALLSKKFNEMAGIVLRHHEELDALVAERTEALNEANRKLEALSATDVLTGLPNRRRLDEVLVVELRRAIRTSKHLAIIMLDVDFFKKYNDYYGHPAGDECLRKVACALQAGCHRAGDLVARYGGEEFLLIAADTDVAGSMVLAESLREAVENLLLPHCDSAFGYVTVSVGVAALMPTAHHTSDRLLSIADKAMYRAKLLGRNRVVAMNEECELAQLSI
jgi:diguanylate cyclase (GGDEF)-like protein